MSAFRKLALAAILAAFGVSAQAQEVLTFTIDQAKVAAREAWKHGDVEVANAIAKGVLQARPEDTAALLLLAATEPLMGRPDIGRRAGARAWASTDNPGLRYEAAYYTSKAAVAGGRFTNAQFWLRRAYQMADDEDEKEALAEMFSRLRTLSPWIARFSFDVSPSSNLNGGASSEFLVIDETTPVGTLSGAARALSGVVASVQGELSYTLSQSPDQRTAITFNGYQTFNYLSDDAKEIAPEAEGSDFDYSIAEVVLSHRRSETPGILPDMVALAFGQTWYGYQALDKVSRLTLAKHVDLTPRDILRFEVKGEHRHSDRGYADRLGREAGLRYFREFESGNILTVSLSGKNVLSDDINQAYSSARIRIGALMGEDLQGFRLGGYVEQSFTKFDDYRIGFIDVPNGREDEEFGAGIDLYVDRVGYLGFTPVVSFQGSRTKSNISRFEAENLGVSIGFRSAF